MRKHLPVKLEMNQPLNLELEVEQIFTWNQKSARSVAFDKTTRSGTAFPLQCKSLLVRAFKLPIRNPRAWLIQSESKSASAYLWWSNQKFLWPKVEVDVWEVEEVENCMFCCCCVLDCMLCTCHKEFELVDL
ncbi:hypothetical protein V1264_015560 [Littorina saxatilis]|uniref:Uncharacterized protein n=1 Tax=Littorina saxatilis TaxID=31220 RepID=A0AAN9GI50_9CAEN